MCRKLTLPNNYFYDKLTIGQESYDDFIRGRNATGNRVGNLYRINSAGEEVIKPKKMR